MTRWERAAPLTGLVAVALLGASTLLVDFYEYLPDAATIEGHLIDHAARVGIGAYLGLLAAVPLLWFAGSVRRFLRDAEHPGRLSEIAFGGGAVAAGLVALAYALLYTASTRAGASSDAGVVTLYDASAAVMGSAVPVALAAMLAAYAVVGARNGVVASWLVGISAFVAVGSVTPFGFLFVAAEALWIVYVSIDLYRRGAAEA